MLERKNMKKLIALLLFSGLALTAQAQAKKRQSRQQLLALVKKIKRQLKKNKRN